MAMASSSHNGSRTRPTLCSAVWVVCRLVASRLMVGWLPSRCVEDQVTQTGGGRPSIRAARKLAGRIGWIKIVLWVWRQLHAVSRSCATVASCVHQPSSCSVPRCCDGAFAPLYPRLFSFPLFVSLFFSSLGANLCNSISAVPTCK